MHQESTTIGIAPKGIQNSSIAITLTASLYVLLNIFVLGQEAKYTTTIILSASIPLFIYLICESNHASLKKTDLLIFSSIPITITISIYSQILFTEDLIDTHGRSTHIYPLIIFLSGFCWMLAGATASNSSWSKNNIYSIFFILFSISVIIPHTSAFGIINYINLRDYSGIESLTHLTLAPFLTLILVIAFSLAKNKMKFVIATLAIVPLWSLGGRSTLLAFILSTTLYGMIRTPFKTSIAISAIIFTLIVLAFLLDLGHLLPETRMLSIFSREGQEADTSTQTRLILMTQGFKGLPDQILTGNAAVIVENFDSMGSYIHNILSIIQFYGIFPFLAFLLGLFVSWRRMLIVLRRDNSAPITFGSIILIMSTLELFATKSITYSLFWYSIGFWLSPIFVKKPSACSTIVTNIGERQIR